MTYPTDEELDVLDKKLASQIGDDVQTIFDHEQLFKQARSAITALRTQLTEANSRADRAETERVMRLSIARKIGMYGSAYDGPFDARAYTYDHQPGNQAAWAIGRAASNATLDKVGDYIDRGLGLLRHLKAEGFGVFSLNDNDACDHTALRAIREGEA